MMELALFAISTLALIVVFLTMVCRANDLGFRKGWRPQLRQLGFVMCGTMPLGMVLVGWATDSYPSPYETLFHVGLALVFITTPNQPPWWRWLWGEITDAD